MRNVEGGGRDIASSGVNDVAAAKKRLLLPQPVPRERERCLSPYENAHAGVHMRITLTASNTASSGVSLVRHIPGPHIASFCAPARHCAYRVRNAALQRGWLILRHNHYSDAAPSARHSVCQTRDKQHGSVSAAKSYASGSSQLVFFGAWRKTARRRARRTSVA